MSHWTVADIPSQRGRRAIVTGTAGLGLETARVLAKAGAEVIIAGRNPTKGAEAVAHVQQSAASASVRFELLDLASLDSVAAFAAKLSAEGRGLELLINNAAVMTPPRRHITADGFELQFGTNYLGHVALTAHLLPLLREGRQARVVSLSSIAARSGVIDFDDLQAERKYRPMAAYSQSKLACSLFALELQRRSVAAGWGVTSVAAHPGISRTDLLTTGAGANSPSGLVRRYLWFLFQPVSQGAWPTLLAATAPEVQGGQYYGPDQFAELRGRPALAKIPKQALNPATAARLWEVSERLARVQWR